MRIWKNIKENDRVIYQNKEYIVLEILEDETTIYATLKKIETNEICRKPLYACRKIETN